MARRNLLEETSGPISSRIALALSKIGTAIKSHSWQGASERGITPTQGQILVLLGSKGGTRLAEVATALAITAATASDAVRALVDKKLVAKEKDRDDARAIRLVLTADGKREAKKVAAWPDFLAGAVDALDQAEQEVFLVGLLKMIRALQEKGEIPIQSMCVSCRFFRPFAHDDPERPHHCAFVDAPFGPRHLRVECPDHQPQH